MEKDRFNEGYLIGHKDAEAVFKPKWIPVSRPPKEPGFYIGLTGLDQIQNAEFYKAISEDPPYRTIYKFQDYITHWMPKPENP